MSATFDATVLSLQVAAFSVLLTLPPALLAATLLFGSRWRFLEWVLLIPLLLPPTVSGFAILYLFSPRQPLGALMEGLGIQIVFSTLGTVSACAMVSFPLAFQACIVGLSRVGRDLRESAHLMCGSWTLNTVRVVWPQMRSAILVAGLLVFARSLGEFGASMMVGGNLPGETQTLPLLVYSFAEVGRYHEGGLAAGVAVVIGLLLYGSLRWAEGRGQGIPT